MSKNKFCPTKTKSSGFTLVELLVVIAIIALLLSILMPALSKVKMQARRTVCASNLHQFGLVLQMYISDDRKGHSPDFYPASAGGSNLCNIPTKQMDILKKMIGNQARIYECPNLRDLCIKNGNMTDPTTGERWDTLGYMYMGGSDVAVHIRPDRKANNFISATKSKANSLLLADWVYVNIPNISNMRIDNFATVAHLKNKSGYSSWLNNNAFMRGTPKNIWGSNHLYFDNSVRWIDGSQITINHGIGGSLTFGWKNEGPQGQKPQ